MEGQLRRPDTPLVTSALASLREVITLLPLSSGNRLPSETDLADRLGISRPVLRQALEVLKQEGLIEARKGSGTYKSASAPPVMAYGTPENLSDLGDCLRFRMVVESAAAALAAQRADATNISAIRHSVEAMENNSDKYSVALEMDMAFHLSVARAAHSRYYEMTLEFLMPHILFGLKLGRQMKAVSPNSTSKRVANEHRAILTAIESRDADQAADKMKEHLSSGIERIFGNRSW